VVLRPLRAKVSPITVVQVHQKLVRATAAQGRMVECTAPEAGVSLASLDAFSRRPHPSCYRCCPFL